MSDSTYGCAKLAQYACMPKQKAQRITCPSNMQGIMLLSTCAGHIYVIAGSCAHVGPTRLQATSSWPLPTTA